MRQCVNPEVNEGQNSHGVAAAAPPSVRCEELVPASCSLLLRDARHSLLPPQVLSPDLLNKAAQRRCLPLLGPPPSVHLRAPERPLPLAAAMPSGGLMRVGGGGGGGVGGPFLFFWSSPSAPRRPSSKKALLSAQHSPPALSKTVSLMIYLLWQRLIC